MPTLEDTLTTFLKIDRSDYTRQHYQHCLGRLIAAIGPGRSIHLVTYEDLLDYTSRLREVYKPSTYHQHVTVIKCFFNWAVKMRYIDWSPSALLTARMPPVTQLTEMAIPADVLDSAMRLAYQDERDYAVIAFIKATAARAGGIASLRIPNLDLHSRQAWIKNKGGRFYWVYFGENTLDALTRYLRVRPKAEHDYVFVAKRDPVRPLSPPAYSDIVARWTKMASGVEYRAHSIRHRTTHDWDSRDVPVDVLRDKLNHVNITTTNHYLPRHNPQLRNLSQQMDKRPVDLPSETRRSKIIYLDDSG